MLGGRRRMAEAVDANAEGGLSGHERTIRVGGATRI